MSATEDDSLNTLKRINQKLREAVVASFPCAYEQYVTISIPGTIIDTRLGGSYLPKETGITADTRNMIQCNESMLVDSMIPLDKVMLGPTGKSVHRSYMTALDMLIPRKTDIGSVDVDKDFNSESTSKYSQAMRFLRSKESILTPESEIKGSRIQEVKEKLQGQGIQGTVVDRYVEKQLAWSVARGDWDAVRSEALGNNLEARESRSDRQSAALFSARQKDLKRAQGVLHARWMDWVVNGDKYRVEYCFSIVDRDSVMARIERGREATRDAMLTSIDGTEWPQVTLEPRNWAEMCRAKAVAWATRNPTSPAHVQLRLDSLKRMKQAYEVYAAQLDNRYKGRKPKCNETTAQDAYTKAEGDVQAEEKKPAGDRDEATVKRLKIKAETAAKLLATVKAIAKATTELTAANTALTEAEGKTPQDEAEIKNQKDLIQKKNDDIVRLEGEAVRMENLGGPLADEEIKIKQALEEIYRYDKEARDARDAKKPELEKTANVNLELAKTRWLQANKSLQELSTKGAVLELESGGVDTMKTSIRGNLKSIEDEIAATKAQLAASSSGTALSAVIGVNEKDKSLILASEAAAPTAAAPPTSNSEEESADVWTNISFSVGSKSDASATTESHVSGAFNFEVGGWWAKVKASSSFSSSSKKLEKSMSDCRVEGSFSAMLVSIKRPWLHSDLFNDFDVDIPEGSKLSPGAEKIKEWVDIGDNKAGPVLRTDYGKFPAYPTAFIVASDTVLELHSTQSNSQEMMSALSTDSSVQASYGPWGLKAGGSVKTDNKESSQKMEVKDGALRIAFQAPQIVGWVSEILPQLPRNVNAGGLTGTPNKAFRV